MKGKINMKRYFQVIGICLAILLIGLLGGLGFGFWQGGDTGSDGEEVATVEISGGKINVLLMGLDEGGLRTDCIMVGSYNTETKEAKLLSIPRDTRMFVGSRYQKINAAHAISTGNGIAGAQGTVEAVSRLTGIPINYYVELPFSAVAKCIDLLGPITFEIPDLYEDGVGMVYDDPVQNLHINLKPGVQELNGDQVVQLLRYRKGNRVNGVRKMYADGDIGRIKVQQQFLQTLVDQKVNASLILKLPALFKQLSDSIKTNFSVRDVISYSKYLNDFKSENLNTFSLPGHSQTIDGASYFVCDLAETRTLIETEFGYDASKITIEKEAKATVAPASAKPSQSTGGATSKPSSTGSNSAANQTPKATSKAHNASQKPAAGTSTNVSSDDEDKAEKSNVTKKPAVKTEPPAETNTPSKKPTEAPEKQEKPVKTESPAETKTPVKAVTDDEELSDE